MLDNRLEILYEDNHLIAINKYPGQVVQSDDAAHPPITDYIKQYIKEKHNKPGDVFLGVIHRIDRPVSGIVLFARTSKALARMNEQFKARTIHKTYLAIVEGKPKNPTDVLKHYLKRLSGKNITAVFSRETEGAQYAELSFELLDRDGRFSLLKVKPVTGRTHQIRAQLSRIGCPIKGDVKYRSKTPNADMSVCLHAYKLAFNHPTTNEPVEITAPIITNQWHLQPSK